MEPVAPDPQAPEHPISVPTLQDSAWRTETFHLCDGPPSRGGSLECTFRASHRLFLTASRRTATRYPSPVNSRLRLIATVGLLSVAAASGTQIHAQTAPLPSLSNGSAGSVLTPAVGSTTSGPALPLTAAGATGTDAPAASANKARVGIASSLLAFGDSLVSRARAQIGTRYKLGGTAPERGFDCSGLVRFVAKAFDIALPRTARQQATMGVAVPKDLAAMKPGDLLTFGSGSIISHIGIYVGEGRFVHASTSQHKVIESSLVGTRSPLIKQWKGVRRVATDVGTDVATLKMRDSVLAMLDTLR